MSTLQDMSTLVEFLLRQQDQADVECAQLPQHESKTIEDPAVIQPMSTLVLETFFQEQELTLVDEPQPQPQHLLRQELLRRHGIVECRVQIQPLPVKGYNSWRSQWICSGQEKKESKTRSYLPGGQKCLSKTFEVKKNYVAVIQLP